MVRASTEHEQMQRAEDAESRCREQHHRRIHPNAQVLGDYHRSGKPDSKRLWLKAHPGESEGAYEIEFDLKIEPSLGFITPPMFGQSCLLFTPRTERRRKQQPP